ncbi:MAG: RluA family pseudouridine synthase, partial [Anaerolineae bacterium]|nr:RluA family pseudouridine synthase [Anaerolineae bacterium]
QVQRLLDGGFITVNGALPKASHQIKAGDYIQVRFPPPVPSTVQPEPIPLRVVYEDSDLLVIDKPAGMVVHPAPGHKAGTLVAAVLAHAPDLAGIGGTQRPGIVHRLDKDTSGLILVAKNDAAYRYLQDQFKSRSVHKVYLALLEGTPPTERGRVEAPIGRDPRHRQRMAVTMGGREAVTEYRLVTRYAGYTLVAAEPKTGRTHQIRVHFSWLGHPVVGDAVYGRRASALDCPRQFLHAHRLGFRLPSNGSHVEFESPLPVDLLAVLARLRQ